MAKKASFTPVTLPPMTQRPANAFPVVKQQILNPTNTDKVVPLSPGDIINRQQRAEYEASGREAQARDAAFEAGTAALNAKVAAQIQKSYKQQGIRGGGGGEE